MVSTRTLLVPILSLCALVAVACASGESQKSLATGEPAPADLKLAKWNQERVTAIATDLAKAVEQLRKAVRDSPVGKTVGSGQENAMLRMNDRLRLLRTETRYLASELQNGVGREGTLSVYERVGNLARDVREEARKMFLPEPIMDAIAGAGATWSRLTPYYVGT